MNALDAYAYVGFVGTACIIAAYFYLTASNAPNPFLVHGTNLAGAALLTVSLVKHTTGPASCSKASGRPSRSGA